jgi:predicted helicase
MIKKPRPHQGEALVATEKGLQEFNRVTSIIMACGTGKSLVELWATEALKPKRALVLVPTLSLLKQIRDEWKAEANQPFQDLCVCSDASIGQSDAKEDHLTFSEDELGFPTCTDPVIVNEFLDATASAGSLYAVVFCTYQSAKVVGEAMRLRAGGDQSFDVGIFDEAHKTVGNADALFGYALLDSNIHIKKRLFFTATPRTVASSRNRNADGDLIVSSMDDESIYGPQVHELSVHEAIQRKLVTPLKIIISVVDDNVVTSDLIATSGVNVDGKQLGAAEVANQIALNRAMEKYGMNKAITFHNSIAGAADFAEFSTSLPEANLDGFERFHVSGAQSAAVRSLTMENFRRAKRGIISNAKCLTEGVDMPAVDLVAFMNPKRSAVDIVQAAGRASRLSNGKVFGGLLLPLHVNTRFHESTGEALKRSDFKQIADVISAIAENDADLRETFRKLMIERGQGQKPGQGTDWPIEIDFGGLDPQGITVSDLRDAIETRLLDEVGQSWDAWLGRLIAYKAEFGDFNVPWNYKTKDGHGLGKWFSEQRVTFNNPDYPQVRRDALTRKSSEAVMLKEVLIHHSLAGLKRSKSSRESRITHQGVERH